jgi:dGTP triphosphohydrolase
MSEDLKPCPRCGAPAQVSPEGVLVGCSNRGYPLHCTDLQWYWRHEWQNRPIEDQLRARIAALESEVELAITRAEKAEAERDALKEELETEKFEHWRTQQVCNQLQQEVSELHALNLYDLVGDADQLRADTVATIKERDELRKSVDRLRAKLGVEIADHAYTKLERDEAITRAQRAGAALSTIYILANRANAEPESVGTLVTIMTEVEKVLDKDGEG